MLKFTISCKIENVKVKRSSGEYEHDWNLVKIEVEYGIAMAHARKHYSNLEKTIRLEDFARHNPDAAKQLTAAFDGLKSFTEPKQQVPPNPVFKVNPGLRW